MRKNWFKEAFVRFKRTENSAYVRYSNFPIKLKIQQNDCKKLKSPQVYDTVMQ